MEGMHRSDYVVDQCWAASFAWVCLQRADNQGPSHDRPSGWGGSLRISQDFDLRWVEQQETSGGPGRSAALMLRSHTGRRQICSSPPLCTIGRCVCFADLCVRVPSGAIYLFVWEHKLNLSSTLNFFGWEKNAFKFSTILERVFV